MVVMMWVIGGGWYKHCRWATSAVMWECLVVVKGEVSSVGGWGACEVSVVSCQVCFAPSCWVLHAVVGTTVVVVAV